MKKVTIHKTNTGDKPLVERQSLTSAYQRPTSEPLYTIITTTASCLKPQHLTVQNEKQNTAILATIAKSVVGGCAPRPPPKVKKLTKKRKINHKRKGTGQA